MAAAADPSRISRLFVAAIDFGTTYSGYAFSSKNDFQTEPLKINANIWNAGGKSLMSNKTPTALLLKPDKTFHSFGYEAENNYTSLAEEGEHEDYYFFQHFKMLLHNNKNLRRTTMVKDISNKELSAQDIFSMSIRYLKDHLFRSITDKYPDIKDRDIQYVLTVPAIWDDAAKQFMRESAKLAGIEKDQLCVALEPEAASLYCQHLHVERQDIGQETILKMAKTGTKYMVVDLGGGTADITVHQRGPNGTLKELLPASGGAWGGKSIDDAFRKFLDSIVGKENLELLKNESMEDYIDLFREFETKKRSIVTEKAGKVSIVVPVSLMDIMKKDKERKNIATAVEQSPHCKSINVNRQKLQIANDAFRELFKSTIDGIIAHVEDILTDRKFNDLQNILMVGGFSECELVQNAMKSKFSDKKLIVPDDPGLAVLKGAVLYGHVPRSITSRVLRRTYGIQSWPEFDPRKHPADKKVVIDGVARCKDAFFKYVEIGQQVTPGHQESQIFQALKPDEETLECTVYWSENRDPVFVDENGCHRLGILTVPLDLSGSRRGPVEVEETMIFGETELLVQAKDMGTGRVFESYFDFL